MKRLSGAPPLFFMTIGAASFFVYGLVCVSARTWPFLSARQCDRMVNDAAYGLIDQFIGASA